MKTENGIQLYKNMKKVIKDEPQFTDKKEKSFYNDLMNFFNIGLFVDVDELLEDYGLTEEKKNEIRNAALKWYKERERTCYDSLTRNWKELMESKEFELDSTELIMIDCFDNGNYDLAIYLDDEAIYKTINAGYTPMKQWGKGYYEVDPPEEWFEWEIKPENIYKVYIGEEEIALTEEDKKEICECLFITGKTDDEFYLKYEEGLMDWYSSRNQKEEY